MSFTDMMSSGRGPGVIGMIMALVVMIGFGLLFVLAFDEGMQGGDRTIGSVIAEQAREINTQQVMVAHGNEQLAAAGEREAVAAEFRRTKGEIEALENRTAALIREIEEGEKALEAEREEFSRYQDEYRAHVRNLAKGRKMDELTTADGTTYLEVGIREVTAIGIQISHLTGNKRIPFEELPKDMIDHFQFDEELKALAVRKEREMHRRHEQAVAAATEVDGAGREDRAKREALANQEKIRREIIIKERQIATLGSEITTLESEIQRARANAAAARSAGRMHIDQEKPLRAKLDTTQKQIAELRQILLRLKANL